jgi:hypothetical protein
MSAKNLVTVSRKDLAKLKASNSALMRENDELKNKLLKLEQSQLNVKLSSKVLLVGHGRGSSVCSDC